jgi:hypothetical protein
VYKPGQHIIAKINGIPTEAKVRVVLDTTDGKKLIVDFGHAQTATIHERDCGKESLANNATSLRNHVASGIPVFHIGRNISNLYEHSN